MKERHHGAYYYSPGKGALALIAFLCACAHENQRGVRMLQPVWDGMLRGEPYVSNAFFAGTIGTASFVLVCTYFTCLDLTHSLSTKVQKDYFPSAKDQWAAAWPQLLIYALGQTATWYSWSMYPASLSIDLPRQAPELWKFVVDFSVICLAGDFLIYWEHRLMHAVPYLRRNIHSIHHTYGTVFSWAGGVVHPLEDAVVILCQIAPILAIRPHPIVYWLFSAFWVVCLVDEHSGHDVWWSPYQILPFTGCPIGGGGAPHDIHHYKPTQNFGFLFTIWDRCFDTFEEVKNPHEVKNPYVPPFARELKSKCQ
jgi:cholesterol 25-hydroxylase